MDEEMKNAEQAANDVKNEGASIFDQLKGMLNEATSGEGNVFDKLKGVLEGKEGDPSIFDKAKELFEGKEGEASMLDQLKEMIDKGTTAAGEVGSDFMEKAKEMFEAKEGEPSLLDKAKEMFGEGAAAAGEMMDKAKDFVEQGTAAATEVAQDLSQKAKDAFEPKEGEPGGRCLQGCRGCGEQGAGLPEGCLRPQGQQRGPSLIPSPLYKNYELRELNESASAINCKRI